MISSQFLRSESTIFLFGQIGRFLYEGQYLLKFQLAKHCLQLQLFEYLEFLSIVISKLLNQIQHKQFDASFHFAR